MADEDKVNEEDFKKEAPAGGSNPLMIILLVVNAVLMGAVAYLQFAAHQKSASAPSIQDVVKAELKQALDQQLAEQEKYHQDFM